MIMQCKGGNQITKKSIMNEKKGSQEVRHLQKKKDEGEKRHLQDAESDQLYQKFTQDQGQ